MTETTKRTTKVWAHRGASGYRPENTLEAFELAIRQGADGIELDVHTSADGELIVMHDENVDRVTDGTGLIKDMTLAQLKELKVSTPAEPSGIYHIPTLAEVLELMRTTDMMVNIELKNSICFYPGMEGKILKLVKEMNMEDQLIYSSFNHYSLLQLKQLNDHVQTGILFSDGWVNPAMYAKNLGINAVHPAVPPEIPTVHRRSQTCRTENARMDCQQTRTHPAGKRRRCRSSHYQLSGQSD